MPPQILRDSKQERALLPKRSALKWSKPEPVCGISVVKREIAVVFTTAISIFGGPNRDRTDDLTDANRTLSQLSYRPKSTVPKAEQKNKAI